MRLGQREKMALFKPEVRHLMCKIFKRFATNDYNYLKMFYLIETATNREMVLTTMKEF